jgi:hypothetical protein
MTKLALFFQDSDLKMGVFYPTGYLVATFPDFATAKDAHQALLSAGVRESDLILSTGQEVLDYFDELRQDSGTLGALMRPLSRFIGTEVINSDVTIQQAEHGAGLIAIRCPEEADALRIKQAIHPYHPSSADWYLKGGVQSLL